MLGISNLFGARELSFCLPELVVLYSERRYGDRVSFYTESPSGLLEIFFQIIRLPSES